MGRAPTAAWSGAAVGVKITILKNISDLRFAEVLTKSM